MACVTCAGATKTGTNKPQQTSHRNNVCEHRDMLIHKRAIAQRKACVLQRLTFPAKFGILKNDGMPNCGARRRQSQGWWQQQQQQQQQPRQYDVTDDDNLPELSISSSPRRKCCRTLVVREETCANSQCIMCRRRRSEATEVSNVGGVDYAAAESISRPKQNWRSQLCGRGVNIAESIVALAWLAESILGDVITLKF